MSFAHRTFLFASLLLCVSAFDTRSAEPNDSEFVEVSLIRLIANPERYDGKPVMLEGIAHFDSKNGINAIFLTRDDKRAGNGLNGIFLVFASSVPNMDHLNDRYVLARGIFHADMKGRLSSFSASLTDVSLVKSLQTNIK